MEDLIQVAIFVAILLLSLLGGSRKKKQAQAQRRSQPRPRPQPQARPRQSPQPQAAPAGGPSVKEQRGEGLEAILDILRGQLPTVAPEPLPEPADATAVQAELDDEARPLETVEPLDEASHRAFHEQYVEPSLKPPPKRVSRYRLTPKTAREAVVWTAIFSPPKGYE